MKFSVLHFIRNEVSRLTFFRNGVSRKLDYEIGLSGYSISEFQESYYLGRQKNMKKNCSIRIKGFLLKSMMVKIITFVIFRILYATKTQARRMVVVNCRKQSHVSLMTIKVKLFFLKYFPSKVTYVFVFNCLF